MSRKFQGFLLAFAVGLFLSNKVEVHAADECDEILKGGIFNELRYTTFDQFNLDVKRLINMSREELQKESASGSVSAPIADYILGAKFDTENFKQLKSFYMKDESIAISSSSFSTFESKLVSAKIVDNWLECKKAHAKNNIVLTIRGEQKNNPKHDFIVNVEYMPREKMHAERIRVTEVLVTNADKIGGGLLEPNSTINAFSGISQVYRRRGRDLVEVQVNFDVAGSLASSLGEISKQEDMPKPLIITGGRITIFTTKDDKDEEVEFHYHMYKNGVPGTIARIDVGHRPDGKGEKWPDGDVRTYDLPFTQPLPMSEISLAKLHLYYDTPGNRTDPKWTGKIKVEAKLSDGSTYDMIPMTEDFDMGHWKPNERSEHRLRFFGLTGK